jgi:hypothetical protein
LVVYIFPKPPHSLHILPLSKPLFDGSDPLIENIKIIFFFMKNAPIQKEVDPPAYSKRS